MAHIKKLKIKKKLAKNPWLQQRVSLDNSSMISHNNAFDLKLEISNELNSVGIYKFKLSESEYDYNKDKENPFKLCRGDTTLDILAYISDASMYQIKNKLKKIKKLYQLNQYKFVHGELQVDTKLTNFHIKHGYYNIVNYKIAISKAQINSLKENQKVVDYLESVNLSVADLKINTLGYATVTNDCEYASEVNNIIQKIKLI